MGQVKRPLHLISPPWFGDVPAQVAEFEVFQPYTPHSDSESADSDMRYLLSGSRSFDGCFCQTFLYPKPDNVRDQVIGNGFV
ncbi:MAG: hypothetical protein Fur0021_00520 [Candidatus Promineifilaceae bacterium]